MRVSSIQPSIYKSTSRIQHQTNVSSKGWRGAGKGAAAGATFLGTAAVIGFGICTGAGLIAGLGLLLGGVAGSGIEDDINDNKKHEKKS